MGAHKKPKKKSTRTTTSKKSPVYPSMLTDPKELARGDVLGQWPQVSEKIARIVRNNGTICCLVRNIIPKTRQQGLSPASLLSSATLEQVVPIKRHDDQGVGNTFLANEFGKLARVD